MHKETDPLPTDVKGLTERVAQLSQQLEQQSQFIDQLLEQIRLSRHQQFGPPSERFSLEQMALVFNEAEATVAEDAEVPSDTVAGAADDIVVPAHRRSRGGRRPLPPELPRVEVLHQLDEADCACKQCASTMTPVGQKISEQLDIVPAQIRVVRHVRQTYRCPSCEGQLTTAPMPAQPIPKSLATPGTLAYVAISKYADGLPLYRQEQRLKRMGIDLPRSTLASWMVKSGQLVQPLINVLRDCVVSYDIISMDETRLQVLKEPGKSPQSQSYCWVQRGGPPDKPIILYDYDPSRSQEVPMRLLAGFAGYLQVDGYEGYGKVCRESPITQLGCWAHARRKFDEALKAQGSASSKKRKTSLAAVALQRIQLLYRIEQKAKALTPEQRYEVRQSRAVPVLDGLRAWLDQQLPLVPPKSALGKAINYAHKQWGKLTVYTQDGRLRIDNNLTENAIRPFVIGRKNFLFCDTVAGANASANLYGLIETAKANDIEPYAYLKMLFTELPKANALEDIEALLPLKEFHAKSEAA